MIKILGSHGNKSNKYSTTCIQISHNTLIDAGNIIKGLKDEVLEIDNIFVSHSHLDHIMDIAFLCDNIISQRKKSIKIYGLKKTIKSIKKHIFNWEIWPDFSAIKFENSDEKVLEFIEIKYNNPIQIDSELKITPIKANHTVPCCGFLVEKNNSGILFSGDTYKNDNIWNLLNNSLHVKTLIIEVSFPSNKGSLAKSSKHLTPKLLKEELKKLKRDDVKIYINHIKSIYQEQIETELSDFGIDTQNILTGGETIDINTQIFTKNREDLLYVEKIKRLNKIGVALSTENKLSSLLDMIVTEARTLTNADGGTLYILNQKTNTLEFTVIQNETLNVHMGGEAGEIKWKPLPLYLSDSKPNLHMVAATCALKKKIINIPDVYKVDNFDFSGTKKFDMSTGYRSASMLVIPLKNHENKIIGVLQLINKIEEKEIVAFNQNDEELTHSLASQAAVSITNTNLINDLENLLENFLKSIIYALRCKSPYTANHIQNMVELSNMLSAEIDRDNNFYKSKHFSEDEFKTINFAALMHDVGKLSTPDYILDKSTKLDGFYDRVEVVKTRAWAIKKEFEVEFLKSKITQKEYQDNIDKIDNNLEMIVKNNTGAEFVPNEIVKAIEDMSNEPLICNDKQFYLLTKEEAKFLMVQKGTLTDEEKNIINNHAQISLDILNKLSFPAKYKKIPAIAGSHHEKLNGTGYPQKLKGDEISFEARILAIADIFEALTSSDRPYKKANSLSTAMKILYFMAKDGELDKGLVKFFYNSGLYLKFAKKILKPEQIDEVTTDFSNL